MTEGLLWRPEEENFQRYCVLFSKDSDATNDCLKEYDACLSTKLPKSI